MLPSGWGDTYFQGLPGQSFDITDLPNGTYFIAVEANPDGLLIEGSTSNNTELREIKLRGTRGTPQGHRAAVARDRHGGQAATAEAAGRRPRSPTAEMRSLIVG